ncbi:MAG: 4Fe-4S binding protein, partial [Clostridia bacterium]|nr:4Fe-4S binding protein [Clostridia bacterium]
MQEYFHSVVLDEDKCIGCTSCIKRCPTQAIRVKDGKAMILPERCIDCGECIRTCVQTAKKSITNSIEEIQSYKYKVALAAPTLMGQFEDSISPKKILSSLKRVGFNAIYEVARGADIYTTITKKLLDEMTKRPLISS